MNIPVITPELAAEFIETHVPSAKMKELFPELPLPNKTALTVNFLIGPETERYAAEPVYGPTGVGYLKSKGVAGLLEERRLIESLESEAGQQWVRQFMAEVEQQLSQG